MMGKVRGNFAQEIGFGAWAKSKNVDEGEE